MDLDSTVIKMTVCGKAAKELGYDFVDQDVIDWYQKNFPDNMRARMLEMFVDTTVMCDQAEPIEGSQETISKWAAQGHNLILITARGPKLHDATRAMVNRLYPEIKDINFVDFNESKMDVMIEKQVHIWIDDAAHGVVDAMSLHVPTIMVSNNYTKYNHKILTHPRLFATVKKINEISDQQLAVAKQLQPW